MPKRHGEAYHTKAAEIGGRIADARREAGGMSQEELADLLHVSVRSVQAYESGDVIPYRLLRELESALGRPAAWLLHGEVALEARDEQFDRILRELQDLKRLVSKLAKS